MTVLHIRSTDAASIAEALQTYMESNHLDSHKLIGQGYDGAAAFSGRLSGVQKRIRTLAAHALYVHCSCHRLQLASIQTAKSVKEVKMMFGAMTNLWKLFFYSPKKVETLANVQAVLNLPELKVVEPSDTRWLSHE